MSEIKHLVKTIDDTDYTDTVRKTYLKLINHYGNSARLNRILEMIKYDLDIKEITPTSTIEFDSWILDKQLDWISGRPVDFREVYNAVLTLLNDEYDIESEKGLLGVNEIEERIWAIFLASSNKNNIN